MTAKEIEYRKDVLRSAARDRAKANGSDKLLDFTQEMELESQELSCREMMESIFCYHGIKTLKDEQSYFFREYLFKYITKLGRERFDQIRNEQIADYEKCTVNHNVFEDNEGCSYNSINWNVA